MMNLLHWRLLVAVADAGNISRAAEEIGMTQSGASQAIAQLEASLAFRYLPVSDDTSGLPPWVSRWWNMPETCFRS